MSKQIYKYLSDVSNIERDSLDEVWKDKNNQHWEVIVNIKTNIAYTIPTIELFTSLSNGSIYLRFNRFS